MAVVGPFRQEVLRFLANSPDVALRHLVWNVPSFGAVMMSTGFSLFPETA